MYRVMSNNHTSFYLCQKENLLKHQKVSKYYESGYIKNILFLFMSLLTTPIDENSPT